VCEKILLIFDLDGTIIDSAENLLKCTNVALKKYNFKPINRKKLESLIGFPLEKYFSHILSERNVQFDKNLIRNLIEKFRDYSHHNLLEGIVIFEGIKEIIESLSDIYLKAIGTTKTSDVAKRTLRELGIENLFDLIQGTDNFPFKPAPDLIFKIQNFFENKGFILKRTIMIGDTAADMKAGKNANVNTILVKYGFKEHIDLESEKYADFIAYSPEEILEYIKRLS